MSEQWFSGVTVTPFAASLLNDASAAEARNTLGVSPSAVITAAGGAATQAELVTALAATPVGGTLIIDRPVNITSTASLGSGRTVQFVNTGAFNISGGVTLTWQGSIIATPDHALVTGNRQGLRLTNAQPLVWVEWFGAVGDGSTDSWNSIQGAINSMRSVDNGEVKHLGSVYAVSDQLGIGNGTTTAISTWHHGLKFSGGGASADQGTYSTAGQRGTTYRAITPANWAFWKAMMVINGPIVCPRFEGVTLDCNGLTGRGLHAFHLYGLGVINLGGLVICRQVSNAGSVAALLEVRDNASMAPPFAAGTTQGLMDVVVQGLTVRDPLGSANALIIYGGPVNNIGFSRVSFRNCTFIRGNASSDFSIAARFIDAVTFDNCFTMGTGTIGTGDAIVFLVEDSGPLSDILPGEIIIIGGAFSGQKRRVSSTTFSTSTKGGHVLHIAPKLSDWDLAPPLADKKYHRLRDDGLLDGPWAGSQTDLASNATAVTTGAVILRSMYTPCGIVLCALRTTLSTVPGAGASRTIRILSNGVAVGGTSITYGAAESGDKVVILATPVEIAAGAVVEIEQTTSGTPANANVMATLVYQHREVL